MNELHSDISSNETSNASMPVYDINSLTTYATEFGDILEPEAAPEYLEKLRKELPEFNRSNVLHHLLSNAEESFTIIPSFVEKAENLDFRNTWTRVLRKEDLQAINTNSASMQMREGDIDVINLDQQIYELRNTIEESSKTVKQKVDSEEKKVLRNLSRLKRLNRLSSARFEHMLTVGLENNPDAYINEYVKNEAVAKRMFQLLERIPSIPRDKQENESLEEYMIRHQFHSDYFEVFKMIFPSG